MQSESRNSDVPASPMYLNFLKRWRPEQEPKPTNLSAHSLGIGPDVILKRHTLCFQTLITTLYVSSSEMNSQPLRHAHLHNRHNQRVGIAEITAPDALSRHITQLPPDFIDTPVHVAILSGPCERVTRVTKEIKVSAKTAHLIASRLETPKLYQVMLLREKAPRGGQLKGDCRLYERVGLGEVLAVMLEEMDEDDLTWRGVLLE
ncbi:hypothetical protein B0T16DRAFT_423979 [Cercophora newfieldiana]|uniref:Uncharacterized protein n=1 Tax=Cercophora newfieldiana TaxID=92897 RepID=A0AA40CJM9_9PEZI|nr:hypothetical protein B0T16DRAFT_423979 [Cercophora newfieldiana]